MKKLPAEFAGRKFDAHLLADLPDGIDPCGENGEFHTCVVAGPMFSRRLAVATGERVQRDGYAYCDLVMEDALHETLLYPPLEEAGEVTPAASAPLNPSRRQSCLQNSSSRLRSSCRR